MRNLKNNDTEYEMKARGIKQDVAVDYDNPYEGFKDKVLNFGKRKPTYLYQQIFRPSISDGIVETMVIEKEMDVICPKSFVDDSDVFLSVYPFGY